MSKYKSWEEFLNKTYPNLYFSNQVQHLLKNGETRDEAVKKYIERLEKMHNKAFSSERKNDSNILKHFYYENYLIKPENISETYFNFLDKQYFNQYGIHMNNEMKKEHIDNIIKDQKKSLDNWINYLCSEDASFYPTWAKYWAFQGMLTIGAYDNKDGIYKKRTKDTVGSFIELNREIFAKCIDYIINLVNDNKIDDINQITSENFAKIYQALLIKQKEINFDKTSIDGIWIKYEQGDNYLPLYNSLQGYGTGWCTAGEDTCKKQIKNGDFYVYYTYDNEGNPKIPRIAIRMDGKTRIGEIRGVAKNQNVESHLEEVLEEKLKEFPDKKDYEKRISDSKKLTNIYEKYQNNIELAKEDLRFIYEIDRKISGFGYEEDPRLTEIKEKRYCRKDYANIFNVNEDEVALNRVEWNINPNKCKVLIGNLDLMYQTSAEGLVLPQYIGGYLDLSGLKSAEGLILPQCIMGNLYLSSLTSANGLILPNTMSGYLDLRGLTSAEGLVLPQNVGGFLDLSGLTSAKNLDLSHTNIEDILVLSGLTSAEGLNLSQTNICGYLNLSGLKSAKNLDLSQTNIGGNLNLSGLTSAEGLVLPDNFNLDKLICKSQVKQELIEQRNKKINMEKIDEQIEENKKSLR